MKYRGTPTAQPYRRASRTAIWGYGFRPFFFSAAVLAIVIIPWWAGAIAFGIPISTHWPASLWHGHEMLFGFITAAIAGFLLTAVPSWTGQRGFAGWPLVLLTSLWASGRLLDVTSAWWPAPLVACVDLLFLPGLAALIVRPLLRSRNRNTPLLAVLTALWACDATFFWGLLHDNPALARHALFIGIDIVLLLITVIGGRIIPAFTNVALKQRSVAPPIHSWPAMTPLAVGSMLAVIVVDIWRPDSLAAGAVALLAAVAHAVRLAQWQGIRTVRSPIVWVLHLSYLWLPVGFALKAMALLFGVSFASFYLHALTIGAATTMIISVMTRASLGHTGRPLIVSRITTWAYGLLTAAAAMRVFGPLCRWLSYPTVILLAAELWTAAFLLFLIVYAPILHGPRADGKPG